MKKLMSFLVTAMLIAGFGLCFAEDEVLIPEPILKDMPVLERGIITITEGWNLIAMPVLPVTPYTVERFIKEVEYPVRVMPKPIPRDITLEEGERIIIDEKIEDVIVYPKNYWKILVVAVYKNGEFEKYPKKDIFYNMIPGEAYFVYAKYYGDRPCIYPGPDDNFKEWYPKTSVTIKGKPLNAPVSLNLNRGWNGVAIAPTEYVNGNPSTNLNQLSKDLLSQNIKAARVACWLAEEQEWEQFSIPLNEEVNITMRPDMGFFLLCEENGLYIPGLEQKIELPLPPKPPLPEPVVSYTGRVSIMYDAPCPYRLECADGTNVPLKGKDNSIDLAIEKAANEYDTEFTVKGSFAVVDLKNPWTGEPVKMKVLVVSEVIPASKRVSYTGRIEGVMYLMFGPPPPFTHVIVTGADERILLKGRDKEIEGQLLEAAKDEGNIRYVEGVMTTMMNYNGDPYGSGKPVEVLLVDKVASVSVLH